MAHLSCGNRPLARCPNQPCCGGWPSDVASAPKKLCVAASIVYWQLHHRTTEFDLGNSLSYSKGSQGRIFRSEMGSRSGGKNYVHRIQMSPFLPFRNVIIAGLGGPSSEREL